MGFEKSENVKSVLRSLTEVEVHWKDIVARVTSSLDGDDLIVLVEPIQQDDYMAMEAHDLKEAAVVIY